MVVFLHPKLLDRQVETFREIFVTSARVLVFYWFEAGRETRGSSEDPKATKTYPAPGVKSAWEENIWITLNQLS